MDEIIEKMVRLVVAAFAIALLCAALGATAGYLVGRTIEVKPLSEADRKRIAIEYMRNASWRHTLCDANNFPMDEDKETMK